MSRTYVIRAVHPKTASVQSSCQTLVQGRNFQPHADRSGRQPRGRRRPLVDQQSRPAHPRA
eukprot:7090390-Prymnesium_polylepis.1